MTRGKKPAVDYLKRHDWLEQYRRGSSPPTIAKKDGYDVRTVRKNLDIAQQELEGSEARTMVYRDALQKHYGDLCSFTEKVDAAVANEQPVSQSLNERMWSALHQHIPANPLWRLLGRWNTLLKECREQRNEFKVQIKQILRSDREITERFSGRNILIEGLAQALLFQAVQQARQVPNLDVVKDLNIESVDNQTLGRYGPFGLGPVEESELDSIQKIIQRLEIGIINFDGYEKLKQIETDLLNIKKELQDNLAVIIFRRIVPGSCRYCPI
jgi:hypothetical protein